MFQVYKALSTIIRESNVYHHTQQNASLTRTLYSFTVYCTNLLKKSSTVSATSAR